MSYLPLPDISLKGSTPGSVTGESVELLPHFTPADNHSLTFEVRVVAAGYVYPATRTIRSFVQRFSVRRSLGVITIVASDSQDAFGDSGGSSWTLAATVGTSPDRFKLTFTTGSTRSIVNVTADIRVTVEPNNFLLSIPVGPIEAHRADLGVTLNAGNVSFWADQTSFHTDLSQSTPSQQPLWNASDSTFNHQASIGSPAAVLGELFSGALSLNSAVGWTIASVYRGGLAGGTFVWQTTGPSTGVSSSPCYPYIYEGSVVEYTGVTLGAVPGIIIGTFTSGGAVSLYVNGTAVRATGSGTTPTTITSSLDQNLGSNQSYVAEQILWPRVINAAEIAQYMNYASARYKIALF